ncbi:hypothetical protein U9M48_019412 [Paspalum notatum var. saurae]|uniref:Uncharacterized protein n=1 Tax=Paspalum notatum var. saurae TaxID=547442 RepID=A0AAQ3TFM0_PASNO
MAREQERSCCLLCGDGGGRQWREGNAAAAGSRWGRGGTVAAAVENESKGENGKKRKERDCEVELKHLLADVSTLAEPNQPGHQVGTLLNVRLIVGVCPELVHKLQLPLLRVYGDLPFDEEALPLFFWV